MCVGYNFKLSINIFNILDVNVNVYVNVYVYVYVRLVVLLLFFYMNSFIKKNR